MNEDNTTMNGTGDCRKAKSFSLTKNNERAENNILNCRNGGRRRAPPRRHRSPPMHFEIQMSFIYFIF